MSTEEPRNQIEKYSEEPSPRTVDVIRIIQENQTTRTKWICGTIALGLAIIGYVVIQVTTPAWQAVVLALITTLLGPAGLIMALLRLYDRNCKKINKRTARLEQQIDPSRTSSLVPMKSLEGEIVEEQEEEKRN